MLNTVELEKETLYIPHPDSPEVRLAFDVGFLVGKPKEVCVEHLASYLLENRATSVNERTNPYILIEDKEGCFVHWRTKEAVEKGIDRTTPLGRMEGDAWDKIRDWLNSRQFGCFLWMSPPTSDFVYRESRFVIYSLSMIGNRKVVEVRGVCGNQNSAECLDIYKAIVGKDVCKPRSPADVDKLRTSPVDLTDKVKQDPTLFLEQFIKPSSIWRDIREGLDWKRKEESENLAKRIIDENMYKKMQGLAEASLYHRIQIGADIERRAGGYGIQLFSGGCGFTNLEMLTTNVVAVGEYTYAKRCGVCGAVIEAWIRKGYICRNCRQEYKGVC